MRWLGWAALAVFTSASAALASPPAQASIPAIPEPEALALFLLGASVVGVAIRRRQP
ncbi:MAG: PEP-CTERM sorting domain-containing protein [Deltaproteobacteria bacterium]|nr:PEP-CTERM sorting domain-containing protein [Deltaproteobacteria bacterium]